MSKATIRGTVQMVLNPIGPMFQNQSHALELADWGAEVILPGLREE